ncbi:MAG TPA: class I SAM-dependent methyltransferase [Gemmata sp.]|nr:class I SAM-dependent methyltransferase [Gemmata sp.]
MFVAETAFPATADALLEPMTNTPPPFPTHPTPDPAILANRELIRPAGYRRAAAGLVAYSAAWYDELEQKRYQRHGVWLPGALEFGRHPGESLLLLGAGIGSDAIHYIHTGTPVTVGVTPHDYPDQLRENLTRHALTARVVEVSDPVLPFADGTFDVVTWNALYDPTSLNPVRVNELFRVLKAGGKVIGLFPAWYDAGFWQDLLLPLQWVYWRRPVDPTAAPKTTARQLRKAFAGFSQHRVAKRHLRRSELPHPWRVFPLVLLERIIGRVLVLKALKPLSARTGVHTPLAA